MVDKVVLTVSYIQSITIAFAFKLFIGKIYLIVVKCLHSSGSLDSHTTLNRKDDLELEIFVFNLSVAVGVIFKLDFIDFLYFMVLVNNF